MDTPSLFFSYSHNDSAFASRLARDLKANGANVWIDRKIAPGERWDRAIEDALENCQHMVLIVSPSSVNSNHVRDEVSYALDEHKPVIPVICQHCSVPLSWRRLQHLDFSTDYERGLDELLQALKLGTNHLKTGGGTTPTPIQIDLQVVLHALKNTRTRCVSFFGSKIGRWAIAGTVALAITVSSGNFLYHLYNVFLEGNASKRPAQHLSSRTHVTQTTVEQIPVAAGEGKLIDNNVQGPISPGYPSDPPTSIAPSDEFGKDGALKTDLWATATPLLASIAKARGFNLTPVQLGFNQNGMIIAGVTGKYQFTGIQSKSAVSPPLSVRACASGSVANGIPIELFLVSGSASEYLVVSANLNPRNGNYHGVSIASTSNTSSFGKNGHNLNISRSDIDVGRWYNIALDVDADGIGSVTISDASGRVLATEGRLQVGRGPFYVVLGQGEGWPYTVGVNKGLWSWLKVWRGH